MTAEGTALPGLILQGDGEADGSTRAELAGLAAAGRQAEAGEIVQAGVEAVQAAQANALLQLMEKHKEVERRFTISSKKQEVVSRLRSMR